MIKSFYFAFLVVGGTKANMTEPKQLQHYTKAELTAKRKKMMEKGVPQSEIEARIAQAVEGRSKAVLEQQSKGKVLKDSRVTETFRPNFVGVGKFKSGDHKKWTVDEFVSSKPKTPSAVQDEILFKQKLEMAKKKQAELMAVRSAFRQHPQEADKIRRSVGKTPEEKEAKRLRKKERKHFLREITGSKKGDWWDPIISMGAEVIPKLLPLIMGMGDYEETDVPFATADTPTSNSLLAASTGGRQGYEVPFMHRHGVRTRIAHREYIGDVYSTTSAFVLKKFPINPGMEELFPWLAPIAAQFTNYRMMGMIADIVSQGSDYSNAAGLGYYALATQYNPLMPAFADKREMLNYQFADAVKPSRNLTHWVECKPGDIPCDEKTVRSGSIPSNADLRLYDHGSLYLAVGGNTAANAVVGQLWVSYDIEFYFPRMGQGAGGVLNFYSCTRGNVAAATPLGASITGESPRNTMDLFTSGTTISFPDNMRGDFDVILTYTGSSGSPGAGFYTVTPDPEVIIVNDHAGAVLASGNVSWWRTFQCSVVGDTNSITFSTGGTCLPVGTSTCEISVSQIPRSASGSTEIFDVQGKEESKRYAAFMDAVLQKEGERRSEEIRRALVDIKEKQRAVSNLKGTPVVVESHNTSSAIRTASEARDTDSSARMSDSESCEDGVSQPALQRSVGPFAWGLRGGVYFFTDGYGDDTFWWKTGVVCEGDRPFNPYVIEAPVFKSWVRAELADDPDYRGQRIVTPGSL